MGAVGSFGVEHAAPGPGGGDLGCVGGGGGGGPVVENSVSLSVCSGGMVRSGRRVPKAHRVAFRRNGSSIIGVPGGGDGRLALRYRPAGPAGYFIRVHCMVQYLA